MQITIKLYASFRIGRFREEVRDYPPATRIARVAQDLEIPEKSVGIVLLNGRHATLGDALHEGDTVSLLPRIGGG